MSKKNFEIVGLLCTTKAFEEYVKVQDEGLFNMLDREGVLDYAMDVKLDHLASLSKEQYGDILKNYGRYEETIRVMNQDRPTETVDQPDFWDFNPLQGTLYNGAFLTSEKDYALVRFQTEHQLALYTFEHLEGGLIDSWIAKFGDHEHGMKAAEAKVIELRDEAQTGFELCDGCGLEGGDCECEPDDEIDLYEIADQAVKDLVGVIQACQTIARAPESEGDESEHIINHLVPILSDALHGSHGLRCHLTYQRGRFQK